LTVQSAGLQSHSDLNAVVEHMHLEVENSHSLEIRLCHLFCFKNSNLKHPYHRRGAILLDLGVGTLLEEEDNYTLH